MQKNQNLYFAPNSIVKGRIYVPETIRPSTLLFCTSSLVHKSAPDTVTVYKQKDIYYNSDSYSFDRYSLQEIKIEGPYSGKYAEASVGDKLRKMNYEIHIGSIWGTPGRILVFFAAIFGASLPVTGLYIFFKTRKKKKKKI